MDDPNRRLRKGSVVTWGDESRDGVVAGLDGPHYVIVQSVDGRRVDVLRSSSVRIIEEEVAP